MNKYNLRLKILQAYKFVIRNKLILGDIFLNMISSFFFIFFKELEKITFSADFFYLLLLPPIFELFFSYLSKEVFSKEYWNLFSCLCYCSLEMKRWDSDLFSLAMLLYCVSNFLLRSYRNYIYEKFDNLFIPIFLHYFSTLIFVLICFLKFK
jgi:hypothetical protein